MVSDFESVRIKKVEEEIVKDVFIPRKWRLVMFSIPWRFLLIFLVSILMPLQVAYSGPANNEGYVRLPQDLFTDNDQSKPVEILVKLKKMLI